jgi:hypothetical protein
MRFNQVVDSKEERARRENYQKLRVGSGGSASAILSNYVASSNRGIKESCASYDAFVSKGKTADEQIKFELEMWTRLKKIYEDSKSGTVKCLDCLATTTANDLQNEYKSKVTNTEVLAAFGEKTYEEFLSRVLIPEACNSPTQQILWRPTGEFKVWPADASEMKIESGFEKIRTNLKKGQVMGLQGLCLDKDYNGGTCHTSHEVVINGYCEKMCDKNNPTNCKKNVVKIQNNWGQTWQDENHDGWVEGETLLKRTPFNNPDKASLLWIENNI